MDTPQNNNNNQNNHNDVFVIDVHEDDLHFIDRELNSNFQLSSEGDDYVNQLFSSQQFADASYTQSYLTQLDSGTLQPSFGDLPLDLPHSHWAEGNTPSFQEVLSELSNSSDLDMLTRF
jgi:hypothetical protein